MKNIPLSARLILSLIFIFISSIFNPDNAQIIATVAGNGTGSYSGDGGQATAAELHNPAGAVFDASGNMYIADAGNNRIRKVSTSGVITTVVGNGTAGFSGNGGQATAAEINTPRDVAMDASGNMYIVDFTNNRIRKINTSGVISTYAGNGTNAFAGDGGQATAAELSEPSGIAIDASGNLYIADYGDEHIRKVNTSGVISSVAGNGTLGYSGDGGQATAAELDRPYHVAVDGSGNLFISDGYNYRIRKVNTSGVISTYAGDGTAGYSGDGGQATAAELNVPTGVVDVFGNVYIADANNERVRKVNTSGIISTAAGNGTAGYSGDGGQATAAELDTPYKLAFDAFNNIYIADYTNNRIRVIYLSLNVSTSVTANVSCNGSSIGSASATAIHGTTPYTYSWSGGGTNSTKTGMSAGTYTITVTDNKSITGTATVIITQPSALTVSANATTNVLCHGSSTGAVSATPSGGTSPYTYSWSGGGTNSTKTGLSAGTYTISITDHNGCTASSFVSVTQPGTFAVVSTTQVNVSCNGGSNGSLALTLSGGTLPYTYSWTNGETTATATGLAAGLISYTVKDNCGATIMSSHYTITQPTALSVSASATTNVFCNGNNTGAVSATPSGGTTPYTYSWSGGGTNSTKTGLLAGTYTITTTDNNGCTATASASVTQPAALTVSAVATTNVVCNGSSTGVASATPSGGKSPYTYSWSGSGTNSTKTGLSAGTYTITTTDNNGCIASASATITQAVAIRDSVTSMVYPTYSGSLGSVTLGVASGISPYTYVWSPNVSTTTTASGLSGGSYTITISDNHGCSETLNVYVPKQTTYNTAFSSNLLTSDANIGQGNPNTSLPVGKTASSYGVSPTGGATYSVPIVIPPGTMGMVPSLSIAYNSQAGSGSLGYGWNLSGLSCISRTGQTPFHNFTGKYPDQAQAVTLTNSDWFTLDGNRLITTHGGSNGANGTSYATESETFDSISSNGTIGSGPDWFKVQTKNGLTIEYGNSTDSRLIPVGKTTVYTWYIDKITDQFGNYITFHYMNNNGEIHIQEIDYTGNANAGFAPYNSIKFTYNNRVDANTYYVAGGAVNSSLVLNTINIFSHSTFFKQYSFKYTSNLYTLLQEIDETGSDNSTLNPLQFSYGSDGAVIGSSCGSGPGALSNYCIEADPSALGGLIDGSSGGVALCTLLDYNGDGKEDAISLVGTTGDITIGGTTAGYGLYWSTEYLYTGGTACPYFTSNASFPYASSDMLSSNPGYPSSGAPYESGTAIYPLPLSNTSVCSLSQSVGDFNGDGKQDYAVSSFTTVTGAAPEGCDVEENVNVVMSNGSTFASPCVLQAYDMENTTAEINDLGGAIPGYTVALSGTFYLDLNGDGKTDVFNYHIDPSPDNGTEYYRVWLNVDTSNTTPQEQPSTTYPTTPPGGTPSPNFEVTVGSAGNFLDFSHAIPMDLNGDGKTELVNVLQWNNWDTTYAPYAPAKYPVIVSFDATQVYGGSHYTSEVDAEAYPFAPGVGRPGNGIVVKPDNSNFAYTTNTYTTTTSSAYNNVYGYITNINNNGLPYELFGDFNGDGITDVISYNGSPTTTGTWSLNMGIGGGNYTALSESALPTDAGENPFTYPAVYYYAVDVNGDGKTDIVEFIPHYNDSNNTVIRTYYSTGTSFVEGQQIKLVGHDINPETWQVSFGDFNGDGVNDLLLERIIADGTTNGAPLLIYFYSGTQSRNMVEAVDGYKKSVQYTYQPLTNSAIYSQPKAANYRSTTNESNLLDITPAMYVVSRLTKVDGTGNNTTTSISKDGLSNYVTYSDTSTTTYTYQDAIFNYQGLGFLGFLNTSIYNVPSGYSTTNTYTVLPQFDVLVPSTSTVTAVSSGTVISNAAYTYTTVALGGLRYFMDETQSISNDDIAGVTNTTAYSYTCASCGSSDNYGNLSAANSQISITSSGDVVQTTEVQKTYTTSATWIPSAVVTTTTTATYLSNPSYTRTSSNTWNTSGHLVSTTSDPTTSEAVTTTNTYDSHTGALLSQTTTSPDGTCATETNSYTYDAYSQFKTSSTNPLGQVTYYTYNPMWGKLASTTTPDGLTTTYSYDAYGRSSQINTPDGLTQTLAYAWITSGELPIGGSDPFSINSTTLYSVLSTTYSTTITNTARPPLQTFYDWDDRQTMAETSTLSANVFKEQAYDAMGHDYQSTNTYQKALISSSYGDYHPVTITKLYDDVEYRLTSVTSTCSTAPTLATTFTYTNASGNSTVTTTKPDGTTSSQTTDPTGLLVNSTDYLLSSPTTVYSTVNYTYFSNGKGATVSLNGNTVNTFAYDAYGRQTNLYDVNFGSSGYTYHYNAYNQLVSGADPIGDTYSITYDVLGRTASKVSSKEGTYTYTYYTSGNGLNQLESQQLGSNTISYMYDNLHRPLQVNVNGLTTVYTYDAFNDVATKTYPGSGFEIANSYTNGFLTATTNEATGAAIWTANYMNPSGQYVDYTLGNGVHTIKSYTPYDMLASISGGSYESMTLDFNPANGNLSSRTSESGTLEESFAYDGSLNSRLVTAATDYTTTSTNTYMSMTYDENGNIINKSNICTPITSYTDGVSSGSVPNNQIDNVPNSPPLGEMNGLITSPLTITYTSFNAPLTMANSNSDYSMTFTYGPDNNRETTVLTDPLGNTTTRTYGNAYEKMVYSNGNPTTEVNYIQCGGDLVAMYVKQGSVDTMNYVYSDHLGSILTVANSKATYNQSFDVWGNYRNPTDGSGNNIPNNNTNWPTWLYRGFTGHEHLPQFQLINANGRLYDPLVGSMLSPDITVQSPTNTQNFNRYSYCMNNPLKYTDPSGFMYFISERMIANEASTSAMMNYLTNREARWLLGGDDDEDDDGVEMLGGQGAGGGGGGGPFSTIAPPPDPSIDLISDAGGSPTTTDATDDVANATTDCDYTIASNAAGAFIGPNPESNVSPQTSTTYTVDPNSSNNSGGTIDPPTGTNTSQYVWSSDNTTCNSCEQIWGAVVAVYGGFLTVASGGMVGEMMGAAALGGAAADYVFYSGGDAAYNAAMADGGTTILNTDAGAALNAQPYVYQDWANLSTQFAQNASGNVNVYIDAQNFNMQSSIFYNYELPALQSNPNVTSINYFFVQ